MNLLTLSPAKYIAMKLNCGCNFAFEGLIGCHFFTFKSNHNLSLTLTKCSNTY